MIGIEPLDALLRKRKCTTDIRLQAILKLLPCLLQKRLLGAVLHTVDCDFSLEARERLVRFDVAERFLNRRLRCIGWEGFEHGLGRGGPDGRNDRGEGFGAPGEQRDGQVAMRRRGENAGYACALQDALEMSGFVRGRQCAPCWALHR